MTVVDRDRTDPLLREALRLHHIGDFAGAAAVLRPLLPARPRDPNVLRLLGLAEIHMGQVRDGRARIERAIELTPQWPDLYHDLASSHRFEGDFAGAVKAIDRGLATHPGSLLLLGSKAFFLRILGEHKAAFDIVAPLIDAGPRHPTVDVVFAMLCGRFGRHQKGIEVLNDRIADPAYPMRSRAEAHFLLGDLYDTLGRHDEAFAAYRAANSLIDASFDAAAQSRAITRLIEAWTPEAVSAITTPSIDTSLPVFILGMPRSGTTLVEQVVSAHPQVAPGGELTEIWKIAGALQKTTDALAEPLTDISALMQRGVLTANAARYVAALQRIDRKAKHVTDKMPLNCLHIGLIAVMLPQARIIHCVREPLDTCLSCYFQLFGGHLPFAYNLVHLGAFYQDYERLMTHWRTLFPGRILDVPYEALVAAPENGARRILDFVGLEWDPRCLQFSESRRIADTLSIDQVRKPIYDTSIGRHKHYEKHLGPLKRALARNDAPQSGNGA